MVFPRILVFASGSVEGGGSGFRKLVEAMLGGVLKAEIVAVVSNHEHGGVRRHAADLGIGFVHMPAPWTTEVYQHIVADWSADFVALSGWLKFVSGLDPSRTFNIHPGPLLPDAFFGGPGMYGHYVHEAVCAAFNRGEITYAAVSMHFVVDANGDPKAAMDRGPLFFHLPVPLLARDTPDIIGKRVNAQEHIWQARITNLVVTSQIGWDGKNPDSLWVPDGYQYLPPQQP